MHDKFDELAKGMAQSVTRRQALRRFSVGIGSVLLVMLGLARTAEARHCKPSGRRCNSNYECCSGFCINYGEVPKSHVCA
jgi:hypothetical protein